MEQSELNGRQPFESFLQTLFSHITVFSASLNLSKTKEIKNLKRRDGEKGEQGRKQTKDSLTRLFGINVTVETLYGVPPLNIENASNKNPFLVWRGEKTLLDRSQTYSSGFKKRRETSGSQKRATFIVIH